MDRNRRVGAQAQPPLWRAFSWHGYAVWVSLRLLGAMETVRRLEALGSKILGLSVRAEALTNSSSGQQAQCYLPPPEPWKEASEAQSHSNVQAPDGLSKVTTISNGTCGTAG